MNFLLIRLTSFTQLIMFVVLLVSNSFKAEMQQNGETILPTLTLEIHCQVHGTLQIYLNAILFEHELPWKWRSLIAGYCGHLYSFWSAKPILTWTWDSGNFVSKPSIKSSINWLTDFTAWRFSWCLILSLNVQVTFCLAGIWGETVYL